MRPFPRPRAVAFRPPPATLGGLFLLALAAAGCVHVHARERIRHDHTDPSPMNPEVIQTDSAPAAIGPYSQAIRLGDLLFCSGQVALDPRTGELVGTTAAEQAEQALANLNAVLEAGGSGFDRVVRCTVFLADMGDFAAVNEVYARHFGDSRPSRATVAVRELPKSALVEIDCIAHVR